MWRKAEGQRSPLRLHACPVLAATSAMLSVRHAYPRPQKRASLEGGVCFSGFTNICGNHLSLNCSPLLCPADEISAPSLLQLSREGEWGGYKSTPVHGKGVRLAGVSCNSGGRRHQQAVEGQSDL